MRPPTGAHPHYMPLGSSLPPPRENAQQTTKKFASYDNVQENIFPFKPGLEREPKSYLLISRKEV